MNVFKHVITSITHKKRNGRMVRSFNRYIGTSPKEYIIRLQIESAKKLLKETTLPTNKIGAIVGLENENYFRHLFKERTKMTPGEYRKSE